MRDAISPEVSIAGSILIDPRCLDEIRKSITPDMFSMPKARAIFEAACELQDCGKTIDPVTVRELVEDWDEKFAIMAMDVTLTSANVPVYCEALIEEHKRRCLLANLKEIERDIAFGHDISESAAKLMSIAEMAGETSKGSTIVTAYTAAKELLDAMEKASEGRSAFVRTGFREIDRILGSGLIREGLYILAARPGCGKTTFAIAIAKKMLELKKRVLFVSLEMSREQLTARMASSEIGTASASQILASDLTEEEWSKVASYTSNLSTLPLFFNSLSSVNVPHIQFLAKQSKADVVIIDYLGLIDHDTGRSLYEKVTITSNKLKRMARSLGIPILCLAQLNREIEGRKSGPMLSDLRDSGAIEQDADGVLLIHKPQEEEETDHRFVTVEVTVAKNRHGRTGKLEFNWYMRNGRILEVSRQR